MPKDTFVSNKRSQHAPAHYLIGESKGINGLSIIVPVYNEEVIIEETVDQLRKVRQEINSLVEIIIVDDGSSDGTAKKLEGIDDIVVVKHKQNRGYGAALKTGIAKSKYQYVAITDADGTYPHDEMPELFKKSKGYDMVVGSRTGQVVKVPLMRKPAKWVIHQLAQYLSGSEIPDLNSGMRIMNKEVVLKYFNILPDSFSFTTTITLAMLCNNYSVCYYPISYYSRIGKSKIKPIRDTINFLQLVIRTVMYFNPLKIFIPLSVMLFLSSFATFIYRIVIGGGLTATSIVLFIAAIQVLTTGMIADLIDKRLGSL